MELIQWRMCLCCERTVEDIAMHSYSLCRRCHMRNIREKRENQLRILEEKLKIEGVVCKSCWMRRPYSEFKTGKKTNRLAKDASCFLCIREKQLQFTQEKKIRKNGSLLTKNCPMCNTRKSIDDFNLGSVCSSCSDFLTIRHCESCNKKYQKEELIPPERNECIYCALKRGRKRDITRLRNLMKGSELIAVKLTEFIRTQHDSYLILERENQ